MKRSAYIFFKAARETPRGYFAPMLAFLSAVKKNATGQNSGTLAVRRKEKMPCLNDTVI